MNADVCLIPLLFPSDTELHISPKHHHTCHFDGFTPICVAAKHKHKQKLRTDIPACSLEILFPFPENFPTCNHQCEGSGLKLQPVTQTQTLQYSRHRKTKDNVVFNLSDGCSHTYFLIIVLIMYLCISKFVTQQQQQQQQNANKHTIKLWSSRIWWEPFFLSLSSPKS